MSPSLVLGAAFVALALPLLIWSFTAAPDAGRQKALRNLHRDLRIAGSQDEGSGRTSTTSWGSLATRFTPLASVKLIDRLLGQAGRPAAWPLERVLVTKLVSTAGVIGVVVLLLSGSPTLRALVFGSLVVAFVWVLPELLIYNVAVKRRQAITLALPDTLDQLTIAVEAGLGFEAALAHVARNSRGPLAEEFLRTLQDIQFGQPRREAYKALTERVDVTDLRRFVRALIQAEQHGVSIARVLATQASEMRIKRRQRAEEKAMQIPVKVVFPLILFILPALFIVILGPAVINSLEVLSGL